MKYLGSKRKHAREIINIMRKDISKVKLYVEPFVGSGAVIQWINCDKRIGNDINPYLIRLLKAIQDGWIAPETVTEEEYLRVKNLPEDSIEKKDIVLKGFIGFGCSFGSMWFKSYAKGTDKYKIKRNYALEAKNNLAKQKHWIKGIEFSCKNYHELEITEPAVIFCDPPYQNTAGYKDGINYDEFYLWLEKLKDAGHYLYISGYDMPKERFKCIWSKLTSANIATKKRFTITDEIIKNLELEFKEFIDKDEIIKYLQTLESRELTENKFKKELNKCELITDEIKTLIMEYAKEDAFFTITEEVINGLELEFKKLRETDEITRDLQTELNKKHGKRKFEDILDNFGINKKQKELIMKYANHNKRVEKLYVVRDKEERKVI